MPKEKNYNPVQAQRKADKARAVKKGKTEVQARRNEKLARKNPERIQTQIDDLRRITTNGGKLSTNEEQLLDGLEKELRSVKKARDALGDSAPTFSRSWNRDRDRDSSGVLGKRRRGSNGASSSEENVPEDVKSIPMPRDTPPPIPKEVMDEWHSKRRARWQAENAARRERDGEDDGDQGKSKKVAEPVESRTVYEAKPVVRDLHKEAVSAFVPAAVRMKLNKGQGQGGLLEPEEADELEREGYMKKTQQEESADGQGASRGVTMEEVDDEEG